MRVAYFFAALAVSLPIFAFEIEEKKRFSAKVAPSVMSARVSVSVSRDSYAQAKTYLDELLREAKGKTTVCKGGEYYIYPRSEYDQGRKRNIQKGYDGTISFGCRFAETAPYDSFLEFLNKKIKSQESERIHISPIAWELTDEEREAVSERLKIQAIEYTSKRAVELSRVAKGGCELKKIAMDGADTVYFGEAAMMKSSTQTPTPQAKEVSIQVNMSFECKR